MSGWKYAFSLSKEEVEDATPPGTVRLIEHITIGSGELGAGRRDQVVKFPKPSADPADPLNLPAWRKIALLLVASIYAFVANFTSSSIAPALGLWRFTFPQEPKLFSELIYLIAVNVLFLGASNIWWVPLSNWLGRRPVLVLATLLMTLCTVWCGLATSFNSLLVARIFQGIGGGAADTVAPALIGDVYFIDERGRAMAVYTIFLCTGSIVGGIAGSYIGYQLGWAYVFWVGVALSGACFLGVALLVPETLYDRSLLAEAAAAPDTISDTKGALTVEVERPRSEPLKPYKFRQSLGCGPLHGSLVHHFMQPWRTLALPGTWVVMTHYAGLVGGIVTISTIGAQLVSMPPYLWGANAGLINIGGLVGAVLGYFYTYLLSDTRLKSRAKHTRHGFAEAEDRLPTLFAPLAVATAGFLVFGLCAQYPGPNRWVGLQAGYAMLAFGLMQVPSIGFNYLIDAYSYRAADCFVIVTILRSVIAFAWTFFVAHWVEERGPAEPFGIFAMLMGLFSLLSIPLWLWGKRMRIATSSALHS